MIKKKKRLSPKLKLLITLPLLLLIASETYAQLKLNEHVTMNAYKFSDIPFQIFFVNISNSDTVIFEKINRILFITHTENTYEKNNYFYISNSLEKTPPKTLKEGIIAFRGISGNFTLHSSFNDSLITSKLLNISKNDNYKEEAYALALILALESYKNSDTLVNYYYRKYYRDNVSGIRIIDNILLENYLKGALIRAKNIYENGKEDLSIPDIKEITKHYGESRNNGNNDTIFSRALRNYYVELARYYSKSDKKEYDTTAGYYQDAQDIEIQGEHFENSDLFNFANALFYIEQDNWAEDKTFNFENCKGYYQKLMKDNFRLCDVLLKLGAIYYMDNYEKGDFSKSKEYFKKVIDNGCKELTDKAEKNLKNINELENKK